MAGRAIPELWSDFDGTGVAIVKKHNPRNWSKYPLPMIDGYIDFLRGAQDGGLDIAGIVSRRPALRRWVTARSIAKLGLDEFFPGEHQVLLAGSETGKAKHVIKRSEGRFVGLIDDKPHKVGKEIIDLARSYGRDQDVQQSRHRIVIGATNHARTGEYIERLAEYATSSRDDMHSTLADQNPFDIWNSVLHLRVIPIDPYSFEAGQTFAAQVTANDQLS